MSEGRRSQVILLDERRLDIVIQSRLYAGELLDIVASHFTLKEKEYFGLAFTDEAGQLAWLQLDKRVLEHEFPKKSSAQGTTLVLYFRIKYFVESITHLRDSSTIEAFYLQIKSLIAKGELEIDSDIIFQLAALVIQATYGDYTDEQTFKTHLKRLPVLPASTLKEFSSISICEKHVLDHYVVLAGQSRGTAIVNYLSIVESVPTYGQHYYEVKEKSGGPCWLGLSYRGVSQYDKTDRRIPRRVFLWKQLENLYFRDKKFTVEVHEARRVVHTLSSFNLYEDAIEEPVEEFDDLSNAICDPTTQVSVSRRALAPASVTVYVWYASIPSIAKCIWSMAIAQHQFFLDRTNKKSVKRSERSLTQIASELCRSVQSLSSASSHSNISRSNSATSLPALFPESGELNEKTKAATLEMLSALQSRKDALEDALRKKTEELKSLCLKEGELTGELPPETPFQPGEAQPQVRRRIGTSFTISDKVMYRSKNQEKETLNALELDYEIQSKIASASYKLANDHTARRSVRKVRQVSYQQATTKLRDIEEKLSTLKRQKNPQKDSHINGLNTGGGFPPPAESAISKRSTFRVPFSKSAVPPATSMPYLTDPESGNSSPNFRQRHRSLQHVPIVPPDNTYEEIGPSFGNRSSPYLTEYDAISCGSGSIGSLGIPYRNRFEAHLDIENLNHYSVPNRRASQAFNDIEDSHINDKNLDTLSICYSEAAQSNRFTPLSVSYDDGTRDTPLKEVTDSNFNESRYATIGGKDSSFRMPQNVKHAHSEHSLHKPRSGSFKHKHSQVHISEPDLNMDTLDSANGIRHVYSVPVLKATLSPVRSGYLLNSAIRDHGTSSQSINQVADLVQASVLLQDCKRAAVSMHQLTSPKTKTKEWVETLLDLPIETKKQKPKGSVEPGLRKDLHKSSTKWVDNGLPPSYTTDSLHDRQFQQKFEDSRIVHRSNPCLRSSPSPFINFADRATPDFTGLTQQDSFSAKGPNGDRMSVNSSQYHVYQNIEEVSQSNNQTYENIPVDYKARTTFTISENIPTPHCYSNLDDIDEKPPIAVPQEPSKPKSTDSDSLDAKNLKKRLQDFEDTGSNYYEPIDFKENYQDFTTGFSSPFHPDVVHDSAPLQQVFRPISPIITNLPDIVNNNASTRPEIPSRQPLSPTTPTSEPLSPNLNFSPNLKVDVVEVGHFQPYWEETKPYELSDFYKYSTKHRKKSEGSPNEQQKENIQYEMERQKYIQSGLLAVATPVFIPKDHASSFNANDSQDSSAGNASMRPSLEKDKSLSFGEMDLKVSDTFHDEMVAWYQNQDNAKKATLV